MIEYVIVAAVLLAGAAALGGALIVARSVKQAKSSAPVAPTANPLASLDPETMRRSEAQAREIVDQGRRDADRLLKEAELKARDEAFRRKEEITRELEKTRTELREFERRLEKKEDALDDQQKEMAKKDRTTDQLQKKLSEKREELDRKEKQLDEVMSEQTRKLSQLTGLSREDAERMLLDRLERELSEEVATKIRQHTESLKQRAEATAREILTTAIQRYAADHTADATVSTVDIPSDDMKGRIIGREGRNIRTFEKATGVDVIVDDTPGVVVVSAFDNVRREVARIALSKLIQDGRIHPSRIEEVVKETQDEMDKHILEVGQSAALEANIGPLHEKMLQLLGRLKFRTSYSQN